MENDAEVGLPDGYDISLPELTPPELTKEYLRVRRVFRKLTTRSRRASMGSGRIWVESNRLAYASVLFTRIVVTAESISRLLPDCAPREHWDFSAVASLTRNLSEAYLWYFWLCEDEIDPDVRQGRFVLLYCHDHGSRKRLFPSDADDSVVIADFERRFDENPWLRTFDEKARRDAMRGLKTPFVQDDVLTRMGEDKEQFRLAYRWFSQHTHTGPVAFFRLLETDRGTGVETELEKRYMIFAIEFATAILERALLGHLMLFPDAETRRPAYSEADVVRAVERNQGRGRRPSR